MAHILTLLLIQFSRFYLVSPPFTHTQTDTHATCSVILITLHVITVTLQKKKRQFLSACSVFVNVMGSNISAHSCCFCDLKYEITRKECKTIFLSVAQQPKFGLDSLIVAVCRSHTSTHARTHAHPLGFPRTTDQLVPQASTYTTHTTDILYVCMYLCMYVCI